MDHGLGWLTKSNAEKSVLLTTTPARSGVFLCLIMKIIQKNIQDTFSQLREPNQALAFMRYGDRVKRLVEDRSIPVDEKVVRILSSQFFRSVGFTEDCKAYLQNKIKKSLEKKEVLTFILPFGAYKPKHSYSYPSVNFSEVFNICFTNILATTLGNIYSFGVKVLYIPDLKEFVSVITQIPIADIETYHNELEEVFQYLVGNNDSFTFISNKKLYEELGTSYKKIARDIEKDFLDTHVQPEDDTVYRSLYHTYYVKAIDKLFLKRFPDAIIMTSKKTRPSPNYINIKSFYNSVVQFWVGNGAFIINSQNKLFPTIASKKQVEETRLIENFSLKDKTLSGISKVLSSIPIYEKY